MQIANLLTDEGQTKMTNLVLELPSMVAKASFRARWIFGMDVPFSSQIVAYAALTGSSLQHV